jgi:hypothetical protein
VEQADDPLLCPDTGSQQVHGGLGPSMQGVPITSDGVDEFARLDA